MMQVSKLSDACGVAVEDIDLSQPLSPTLSQALGRLFDGHGLVVIRDQKLAMDQLVAATEPFGGVERNPVVDNNVSATPASVISSRGANGDVLPEQEDELMGYVDWHSDEGYLLTPNRGKLLYAVEVPPEGGMTGFIDGHRTYAALPASLKTRIAGLHVVQGWSHAHESIQRNRKLFRNGATQLTDNRFPDVVYPLVMIHPVTGGQSLNLPRLWASRILEMPGKDGRALFDELLDHILRPEFAYWHSYAPGDIVAWDNWRFLHAGSGTPGRYVRTLWRTVIQGSAQLGSPLEAAA